MKLAIVRLRGGLGNQMFQYAAALSFAHTNSIKYVLTDNSLFHIDKKLVTQRNFELDIFNLKICTLFNYKFRSFFISIFYLIFSKIKIIKIVNNTNIFNNNSSLIYLLDDYFQNESFFINSKNYIKEVYSFDHIIKNLKTINLIYYKKIVESNSIAIHIRRGDYLNSNNINYHGVCNIDYYKISVNHIEKEITDSTYFIFSDDIKWAKNNFTFLNSNDVIFIDNNNAAYIDMVLMSKCKHNIISNSTFSWWSAWLNDNINKIVIAPSNWFVNNSTTNRIIPDNWVAL